MLVKRGPTCFDPGVARLVDSLEVQLGTDFALLSLTQEPDAELASGPYATSAPGSLALMAGTKYAEMDVRIERWDGEPPGVGDEWEDRDVLPWQPLPESSEAHLAGFDPADDGTFSLGDLGRARVEVLAWGRNRYGYSDGPDDWLGTPRERWLLRFWPDPDCLDALTGPPRRLIGRGWLPSPTDAFSACVDALETTGWTPALSGATPFDDIFQALLYQRAAFTAEELPPPFVTWTWETEVGRHEDVADGVVRKRVAAVGRAAGVEIRTYRDGLRALIALGVFTTVQTPDGPKLAPNPTPPVSVWDIIESVPPRGYGSPRVVELKAFGTLSEDLLHLARWAPGEVLRATPVRIASRLGVAPGEALGALGYLAALGHVVEPAPHGDIDPSAEIALSARVRAGST